MWSRGGMAAPSARKARTDGTAACGSPGRPMVVPRPLAWPTRCLDRRWKAAGTEARGYGGSRSVRSRGPPWPRPPARPTPAAPRWCLDRRCKAAGTGARGYGRSRSVRSRGPPWPRPPARPTPAAPRWCLDRRCKAAGTEARGYGRSRSVRGRGPPWPRSTRAADSGGAEAAPARCVAAARRGRGPPTRPTPAAPRWCLDRR